ncbi:hypothetical protein CEXT_613461 [Caerostris extrusa]|uniref:Uncharacterized protein n=1 Tax=Caerostris extrusa TaxID=172846 RepID=A0AAV4R959_CAEEX|nr:hypothetical protein CEXT_613461 [Caerostris extrusa]
MAVCLIGPMHFRESGAKRKTKRTCDGGPVALVRLYTRLVLWTTVSSIVHISCVAVSLKVAARTTSSMRPSGQCVLQAPPRLQELVACLAAADFTSESCFHLCCASSGKEAAL